ncbi:PGA [Symbiodinium microadriaticum]|nr:PGA [Symbiodinium microadriaticum]
MTVALYRFTGTALELGSNRCAWTTTQQICTPRAQSLQSAADHICLGDICTHGNFISVTEETEQPFSLVPFDGIFGLGLPQMSQAPHFNVLDCMIRDKVLKKNLFSVFLAADDRDESEISFGEFKSDRMADQLFWVPVSNPGYWQVEMEDVAVGDKLQGLCNGKCQAAVDTGTSLLAGPSDVVRTVADIGFWHFDQEAADWTAVQLVIADIDGTSSQGECSASDVEKEYYERDERDAEEGWAIDVLDDDTHRGSSLCQAMSNGGEMDILVSLFLDILDRLLKQILTPSPRQSRVVRPMLGDKVAWLILVAIHFTARVVDGDIFETTREDNTGPLKFRIGHGEVMRGLEES